MDTRVGRIIDDSRAYVKVDTFQGASRGSWKHGRLPRTKASEAGLFSIAGIGFAIPVREYKTGRAMFEGNDKYEALYNVKYQGGASGIPGGAQLRYRFMNDATSLPWAYPGWAKGKGITRSSPSHWAPVSVQLISKMACRSYRKTWKNIASGTCRTGMALPTIILPPAGLSGI